jgi:hypothetical protein
VGLLRACATREHDHREHTGIREQSRGQVEVAAVVCDADDEEQRDAYRDDEQVAGRVAAAPRSGSSGPDRGAHAHGGRGIGLVGAVTLSGLVLVLGIAVMLVVWADALFPGA